MFVILFEINSCARNICRVDLFCYIKNNFCFITQCLETIIGAIEGIAGELLFVKDSLVHVQP